MTEIRQLEDKNIDIYPITTEQAIYDANGKRLDNKLNENEAKVNKLGTDTTELKENLTQLSSETLDIKMLGWSVPKELGVSNYMDADRNFHQRVGRMKGSELTVFSWNENRALAYRTIEMKLCGATQKPNIYTNKLTTVTHDELLTHNKNYVIASTAPDGFISIYIASATSVSDITTYLADTYLYFELEEEIVTPIDGNEFSEKAIVLGTREWLGITFTFVQKGKFVLLYTNGWINENLSYGWYNNIFSSPINVFRDNQQLKTIVTNNGGIIKIRINADKSVDTLVCQAIQSSETYAVWVESSCEFIID